MLQLPASPDPPPWPRIPEVQGGGNGQWGWEVDGQPPGGGPGVPQGDRATMLSAPALAGSGARAQPSIWWACGVQGQAAVPIEHMAVQPRLGHGEQLTHANSTLAPALPGLFTLSLFKTSFVTEFTSLDSNQALSWAFIPGALLLPHGRCPVSPHTGTRLGWRERLPAQNHPHHGFWARLVATGPEAGDCGSHLT